VEPGGGGSQSMDTDIYGLIVLVVAFVAVMVLANRQSKKRFK
jgi:hypothetical protein